MGWKKQRQPRRGEQWVVRSSDFPSKLVWVMSSSDDAGFFDVKKNLVSRRVKLHISDFDYRVDPGL